MNILVITQHIFPIKSPRAHRSTELIKELARQGHTVVVYAVVGSYDYSSFEAEYGVQVKPIPIRYQWIPYSSDGDGRRVLIDKILERLLSKRFQFPYIEFVHRIPSIISREQSFDALISIAAPHHIHWGCSRAKAKYPRLFPPIWIADCGDPFMNNNQSPANYQSFARYEHLFCSSCDFISVPAANAVDGYYPEYKDKIRVIPQGFNFKLPIEKQNVHNDVITFCFAGIFYKDIRNPKLFLEYLLQLSINFKFVVYTPYTDLLEEYRRRLGDRLEIHAPIDRNELLLQLRTMDFLLNIENANSPNQTPSKLIDYALTGRPILSINPLQPDYRVIDEFFAADYTHQYRLQNIEQYQISNVASQFIRLIQSKS